MDIDTKLVNRTAVIAPKGSVDSSTSDELEAAIKEFDLSEIDAIVFDFADVDYVSSKCLRVLVGTYRKMEGKTVRVEHANTSVANIFYLSGLKEIFGM